MSPTRVTKPGRITITTNRVLRKVADVQHYYLNLIKAAEKRAKSRLAVAKTQLERERIQTDLKIEKDKLRMALLRSKTALTQEKAALKRAKTSLQKAKRAAGERPISEHIAGGFDRAAKIVQSFRRPVAAKPRKAKKKQDVYADLWG